MQQASASHGLRMPLSFITLALFTVGWAINQAGNLPLSEVLYKGECTYAHEQVNVLFVWLAPRRWAQTANSATTSHYWIIRRFISKGNKRSKKGGLTILCKKNRAFFGTSVYHGSRIGSTLVLQRYRPILWNDVAKLNFDAAKQNYVAAKR